jgi:hypothetical protein
MAENTVAITTKTDITAVVKIAFTNHSSFKIITAKNIIAK